MSFVCIVEQVPAKQHNIKGSLLDSLSISLSARDTCNNSWQRCNWAILLYTFSYNSNLCHEKYNKRAENAKTAVKHYMYQDQDARIPCPLLCGIFLDPDMSLAGNAN